LTNIYNGKRQIQAKMMTFKIQIKPLDKTFNILQQACLRFKVPLPTFLPNIIKIALELL